MLRLVALAFAGGLLLAGPAAAQNADVVSPRRFEIGTGGIWGSGIMTGSAVATETTNEFGPAAPTPLFRVEGRLGRTISPVVRIGVHVNRRITVEAAAWIAHPRLGLAVTQDAEGAADVETDGARVSQYLVEGAVLVHLVRTEGRWPRGPFVRGSIGYLREVTENGGTVETGRVYQIGGGWRRPIGASGRIGVRVDGHLGFRVGGVTFETDAHRRILAVSGGGFVTF